MKTFLLIVLSLSLNTEPDLDKIMEVLKVVETQNRPHLIGDGGRAYGILQIHKVCVVEVNRYYGTTYRHKDCLDEVCSEEIFKLYIMLGIKKFKKKYNKDPTEQDIVRMWNGGLYSGYLKSSTIKYYRKYLKYKKALAL